MSWNPNTSGLNQDFYAERTPLQPVTSGCNRRVIDHHAHVYRGVELGVSYRLWGVAPSVRYSG